MDCHFLPAIRDIAEHDWDTLWASDYPFTRHRFLRALEDSGCTGRESGWQPHHLTLTEGAQTLAVMPLYLKYHSYGEYVFDWGWADAYHRHGLDYYPKLLNAIPFTPATGPRWGCRPQPELEGALIGAIVEELGRRSLSSFHCLFPQGVQARGAQAAMAGAHCATRRGHQYHWFNRNYRDFDDFLADFSSRKRKSLKKERRKVYEQGFEVTMLKGEDLTADDWQSFYQLYARTYLKRSGHLGYLNEAFFMLVGRDLADHVAMAKAFYRGRWVAAALYFYDRQTLFGRYWGAVDEFDSLHFECCYYQGIEFAIQQGLQRFDPGAQGEHKIQRGFVPVVTQSLHCMQHPAFAEAVAAFVDSERQHNDQYCRDLRAYLPFKEGVDVPAAESLL